MNIPTPYYDELLTSWLFRISRANYTRISVIVDKLFKLKRFYERDFDLYNFSKIDLNTFYKITKLSNIEELQLRKYNGFLEENIDIKGRKRWLTPISSTSYKNIFYSTRFCPKCLKEAPYLKQEWRLMIVNICEKHLCFLQNYCPNCKKGLKYPNLYYDQKLSECYNCGFDLTKSEIVKIKSNSLHIKTHEKLLRISESGYYKLNQRYYYSIGLFYLLRIIVKNIMKSRNINIKYIETAEPRTLSFLISYSILLLKNFPFKLNQFYKKNKFSNTNQILDKYRNKKQNIPAWYLSNIEFNTISTRWYF
ncbi:TniQ family protein [Aliarcobacter butzleri]|uniref:TniQ family protein n=1 Tax=Aliarcobacter butzleri TaxID=28197 RepID=UPI001EE0A7DB|nr:TniQ family protein [Aliarcobacter butzleri]MCG3669292.1 TniQ family protein [Aliarcobacter butzleri]